jgi:hypothetical protein
LFGAIAKLNCSQLLVAQQALANHQPTTLFACLRMYVQLVYLQLDKFDGGPGGYSLPKRPCTCLQELLEVKRVPNGANSERMGHQMIHYMDSCGDEDDGNEKSNNPHDPQRITEEREKNVSVGNSFQLCTSV